MEKEVIDILIVDDQPGVRSLLDILIREEGHNTILASNGLEAIEITRAKKPPLIFMDIKMPVMDGIEALSKIKQISPNTQVVMMSAYATDDAAQKAEQYGAFKSITKPFDVEEIKSIIESFFWYKKMNSASLA